MNNNHKINVLIADRINLHYLHLLNKTKFNTIFRYGLSNDKLLRLMSKLNSDVLIIKSRRKIDKIFLARCNLKALCTASKGTDHIDTIYAEKLGIKVINSETGNTLSAAEHTFALILDSFKKTHYADFLVRNRKFEDWTYERKSLSGKKIGIIGVGKVGSLVAKFALAFGMTVLANDIDRLAVKNNKHLRFFPLEYLLKNSDIITVHIPLNEMNRNFINRAVIEKMRDNAIFVNTSRGEVVDEDFLIKKAISCKNFFIALDVFRNEPNPDVRFLRLRNAVLTNHAAGKTLEGEQSIGKEIFKQVNNMF